MLEFLGIVLVALITGATAIYVKMLDKNNSSQHHENLTVLNEIKGEVLGLRSDVADVREDQLEHLRWHSEHPTLSKTDVEDVLEEHDATVTSLDSHRRSV